MIANYHTHTYRCNHADGTEREYVERAIESGLKILGFSDHTPYPFPEGYISGFRMRMDQLEDYVNTILSLKEEYKKDIEIHLGFEVEYYPLYFSKLQQAMADYPVEYFILGQHFLGNEIGEHYNGAKSFLADYLKRYCTQVEEGLETGYFTYLAHPDLMYFVGNSTVYEQQMRKICIAAKKNQIPLEINFLGITSHRNYPNEKFWKIAGEVGNDVIFGADAHTVQDVWNPSAWEKGQELVEKYQLHLIDTVEFRKPLR
ncbi:MAG: histidinol-phosphatase [Lachnospiraceae bacterium]